MPERVAPPVTSHAIVTSSDPLCYNQAGRDNGLLNRRCGKNFQTNGKEMKANEQEGRLEMQLWARRFARLQVWCEERRGSL